MVHIYAMSKHIHAISNPDTNISSRDTNLALFRLTHHNVETANEHENDERGGEAGEVHGHADPPVCVFRERGRASKEYVRECVGACEN